MTDAPRRCRYEKCCRPLPVTHRADAEFCNELCRSRDKNESRRQAASATRVNRPQGGAGSRGGNVRSVDEAQILHRQHKVEWTSRIRVRIAETLIGTDYFHADDLANLEVPDEHSSIIGSQVSLFQREGWMAYAGRRASQRPAANARKSNVYRITDEGRAKLPELIAGAGSENPEGTASKELGHDGIAPSTGRQDLAAAGSSIAAGPGEAPAGTPPPAEPARLFDLGRAA